MSSSQRVQNRILRVEIIKIVFLNKSIGFPFTNKQSKKGRVFTTFQSLALLHYRIGYYRYKLLLQLLLHFNQLEKYERNFISLLADVRNIPSTSKLLMNMLYKLEFKVVAKIISLSH